MDNYTVKRKTELYKKNIGEHYVPNIEAKKPKTQKSSFSSLIYIIF